MRRLCEISTELVQKGAVPANSPLGILGLINSENHLERTWAFEAIMRLRTNTVVAEKKTERIDIEVDAQPIHNFRIMFRENPALYYGI